MLDVKEGTYGIFTTSKGTHTGYIAFYYTAATFEFISKIVTKSAETVKIIKPVDFRFATLTSVPKEGYLLISPEGIVKGISDIQEYQQKRLKSEVRKSYAEIAAKLEAMLKTDIEYQQRIDAEKRLLATLDIDRKYSFMQANEELRTLKADLKATLDSKVTLNQIARAMREQKPATSVSKTPQVWVKDNTINITSTGIIEKGYIDFKDPSETSRYIAKAREKFGTSAVGFPKHIGRMRVTLEERVSELADSLIAYKHSLIFYYPCDLTYDDVKVSVSALKLLGLIPTMA